MLDEKAILGIWHVQNPDHGEALTAEIDRILTSGHYQFLRGGLVNINLLFRGIDGKTIKEPWVAEFRMLDDRRIQLNYLGAHAETMLLTGDGEMRRERTTRPAVEKTVILTKAS